MANMFFACLLTASCSLLYCFVLASLRFNKQARACDS